MIIRVLEITLPQLYSVTAGISHCVALKRDREFKFLSHAVHRLPRFRRN